MSARRGVGTRANPSTGRGATSPPMRCRRTSARFPSDSENATPAESSVAGTEEANEAVLDAHLPADRRRSARDATIEVEYDGEPQFEMIDDTDDLRYAVNTADPVILAQGPLLLRPGRCLVRGRRAGGTLGGRHLGARVESTSCRRAAPCSTSKYVYVYESTPDVVYVGYTPGYTGCHVYHTTVVYGTGYYYRPWYGTYYYARPATWGSRALQPLDRRLGLRRELQLRRLALHSRLLERLVGR